MACGTNRTDNLWTGTIKCTGIIANSSATKWNNEVELLAGVYDPRKRLQEVTNKLQASFAKIRDVDLRKDTQEGFGLVRGRGRGRIFSSKPEDVVVMSLKGLEQQIDDLQKEIEKYEGPHFTRAYRTQQGLCSKLQTDLDALDVAGRDDIRKQRKDALMRIDGLAKQLSKKSHHDGRSCNECEVQE